MTWLHPPFPHPHHQCISRSCQLYFKNIYLLWTRLSLLLPPWSEPPTPLAWMLQQAANWPPLLPVSTQQPGGSSSKQTPYDGHKALLSQPLWSFPVAPLLMPLQSSWPPFRSSNTLGLVLCSVCICCSLHLEHCLQKAASPPLGFQVKHFLHRGPPDTYMLPRVPSILLAPNFSCFFLFKFYLFIYLFLAVLGLRCFMRVFSSGGALASHCHGFSCCGARALGVPGPVVVACRLSSCGAQA